MHVRHRLRRWALAGLLGLGLLGLGGCGSKGQYPVRGKLVYADNEQPVKELAGQEVIFSSEQLHISARGAIQEDGSFQLGTARETDGAPPGLGHPLLAALIGRNDLMVRAKLGWTDVARFAAHGIPAANFGPGDPTLAHTADERVERATIETTFSALDDLLRRGV